MGILCSSLDDICVERTTLPKLDDGDDRDEIQDEKSLQVIQVERKYPESSILSVYSTSLVSRRTIGMMCFNGDLQGPALFTSSRDLSSVMKEKIRSLLHLLL